MRRKKGFLLFMALTLLLFFARSGEKQNEIERSLPAHYTKWLKEDVSHIITQKEKEVFLKLKTDNERDIFIQAFWKQRDPTSGTPENEFKEEHYRRLAYANQYFGRETTRPGWQTDRGTIHIILGPPRDIIRYEGEGFVYPARIWFYDPKPEYDLPYHFHLVFFKRKGMGEFVLYSPARDGPASLLINYRGDPGNITTAYQQLRKHDFRLAEASISFIPGEVSPYGRPSLTSEILVKKIYSVPEKTTDWKYAEALLKFKDIIEVEYTANFINSETRMNVIQDKSGMFFIHYSIEPEKLSVLSYEEKYRINFELNGIITDFAGNMIFQFEKTFSLSFNEDQIKDIQKTSIMIQDMVPLITGDYKFSLLLKNTVSKEFSSFERNIYIPENLLSFQMSPLLLGYQLRKGVSQKNVNKPFKIDDYQISCPSRNVFHPKEDLVVFFQIRGLTQEFQKNGRIKFTFFKKEEEFLTKVKNFNEYTQSDIFETFPLGNFPPDYFRIRVALLDREETEILFDEDVFEISPLADLPRPWVISKVMPSSQNIVYSYIRGAQFAQKGNLQEAEHFLKKAFNEEPTSLKYALSYGEILYKKKAYQKVKEILLPLLEDTKKSYKSLPLLGASCQALKEYEEAISYYKEYLSHAGTTLNILNSIGECYYRLGNIEEALIAWQKSLEIDSNQEELKRLVNRLKIK
ncbi:MAG: GWxTD domain-containing protein [Candidatus Aminicenantes bacterium]|nr:MAG: GWxTD domain-containing protein [Candidatus Aminicenantes bacterium]